MLLDRMTTGKTTAVGAATGIVVGLVAITPAAGFVGPAMAMVLGFAAAFPSYYAIMRRPKTRLDDSLDVTAAHGLGGLTGALLTGVFAAAVWGGADGLLSGNARQLLVQAAAAGAVIVYSGAVSWGLLELIRRAMPLRVDSRQEGTGLDVPFHGEEAYTSGEGAILVIPPSGKPLPAAVRGALGRPADSVA
jgi:Amt family ammonium transporter